MARDTTLEHDCAESLSPYMCRMHLLQPLPSYLTQVSTLTCYKTKLIVLYFQSGYPFKIANMIIILPLK